MDNPYPICENCIFVDEPIDKDPCRECNRAFLAQRIKPNFVRKRKPKTNYDRIISKSPEELAKYFAKITECGECEACLPNDICMATDELCKGAWLDWLKQEASD